MQKKNLGRLRAVLTTITLLAAADASALRLELAPAAQAAAVGDLVTFAIIYQPERHPYLGGGVDIAWDPSGLEIVSFGYGVMSNPLFEYPAQATDGLVASLGVARFSGYPDPDKVAFVSFRVLREGFHVVTPQAATAFDPRWPSAIDFGTFVVPDFHHGFVATAGHPFPWLRLPAEVATPVIAPGTAGAVDIPIRNAGTGPLDIDTIELVPFGSDRGQFSIAHDDCAGQTLAAGAACLVTVAFAAEPVIGGRLAQALVRVTSSDLLRPDTGVSVRADIGAPRMLIPDEPLFDATTQPPFLRRTLQIQNIGEEPATVDSVELSHISPVDSFELVRDACTGSAVAPGGACEIELETTPDSPGKSYVRVNVRYNALFLDRNTLLSYTTTGIPVVDFDGPQQWDMTVGQEETRAITITNDGPVPLYLGTLTWQPQPAYDLLGTDCSLVQLAPDAFCNIELHVRPPEIGEFPLLLRFGTDSVFRNPLLLSFEVTARERAASSQGR